MELLKIIKYNFYTGFLTYKLVKIKPGAYGVYLNGGLCRFFKTKKEALEYFRSKRNLKVGGVELCRVLPNNNDLEI